MMMNRKRRLEVLQESISDSSSDESQVRRPVLQSRAGQHTKRDEKTDSHNDLDILSKKAVTLPPAPTFPPELIVMQNSDAASDVRSSLLVNLSSAEDQKHREEEEEEDDGHYWSETIDTQKPFSDQAAADMMVLSQHSDDKEKQEEEESFSPRLVPLRRRANSDLLSFGNNNQTTASSSTSKLDDKETPERWRTRLWPGKAIVAYCRLLTRCTPPVGTPGEPLRLAKQQLGAHWKESELVKIGTHFESPFAHSAAFFLLTAEESRAAVMVEDDASPAVLRQSTGSGNGPEQATMMFDDRPSDVQLNSTDSHKWLDCEVLCVVAESEYGALPQACDPRLGSVWVVSVAIRTPNVSLNEAVSNRNSSTAAPLHANRPFASNDSSSSSKFSSELSISGGDLMLMNSKRWDKPLLGVIQPWDPDYDIKFGVNFNVNQSSNPSIISMFKQKEQGADVTIANILVCVDGSDQSSVDIGGWAPQGAIFAGVSFQMAVIGKSLCHSLSISHSHTHCLSRLSV
jgi:hypothetical protein